MGSSFTVPEKIKISNVPKKETMEMRLNVDNMYEQIKTLNQINDELYIGIINEEKKKQLIKQFPEFLFIESGPGNLHKVIRSKYNNDKKYCCKSMNLFSYWQDNNGNITDFYKPNSILSSCDPDIQNSGICDDTLLSWCNNDDTQSNSKLCYDWINSALNRNNSSSEKLINELITTCSNNANTKICNIFLHCLRVKNTETFDNVIDYILYSQSDDFKQKYMKCSYPSNKIINESLKFFEARECWDPNCSESNLNFLLTKNYKNLGLCKIDRCNISINNLFFDERSSVRMSCNDEFTKSNFPINKEKIILHNVNNSFQLKIHLLTILSLFVVWVLIVAI
ncbi:myristylprotein [Sheeppox virus]|uniref:Myristylprotein n=1 Tax=Sheeppox virus TaxID=10266 RepID=A0A2P1A9E3_SHEV|nr:poxvirus myristoylprotein [Sheeppox virus]QEJ79658.1 myristylprotein [Sheeppox virus]